MARPKSDEKRIALLNAAARVIDAQGLGAPTALIAREAGLANGTLFNYFPTKSDLLNHLYLELKRQMAMAALVGVSDLSEPYDQFSRAWTNWMRWAVSNPEKRRTLAQLGTCDEVLPATREEGAQAMGGLGAMLAEVKAQGPMASVPMPFLACMVDAIANATMEYMTQDPENAEEHCQSGFEALWRAIGAA